MSQRPTLHDVSAAAQVSTYTVSKALSGGTGVSEATRLRVQEIAAQIGYVPNQHARSLKSPQSTAVAVLTANIANQYYAVLVSSLEAAIEHEGYSCVTMDAILNGSYSQAREDRFVAQIMAQRVSAVVVTYNLSEANMKALASWGVPLIFVDCSTPEGFEQYSSVTSDGYLGSVEMGMHLAGHGYKRWAFVGHTGTWSTRLPRQNGFEAAAKETGCSVRVLEGSNSSATSREAVMRYLAETPRSDWPEVFYASNTVLLHGIFEALRSLSLSIPQDIAVVAFDDFEWAEMLDPPVTVVDQDIKMIGRMAGSFLLRALKDNEQKHGESFVLKPALRIRQSCGCGSAHRSLKK
ncbi:LacI family DNA-binding transcriptional regulator [Rhizobium jaguaris]|uniref:LacI family DNA-binding transcriptional regulator n=1 Tax=Rhizobium jaguaris TaxID=1312183 RepID=UPI0039BF2C0F